MHKGLLIVNPTSDVSLPRLFPGAYVAILTQHPLRRIDLEFRDTLLVLSPGLTRVCFLLRKPLGGATLAQTALEHGTGGLAVDACRIRWQGEADRAAGKPGSMPGEQNKIFHTPDRSHLDPADEQNATGRWPTNLAFVHSPDCSIIGTKRSRAPRICRYDDGLRVFVQAGGHPYTATGGGSEDVPVWDCSPACPVTALDVQSGTLKTTYIAMHHANNRCTEQLGAMGHPGVQGYNDVGGASRYYPQFSGDPALFDWIERLITPPDGCIERRIFV